MSGSALGGAQGRLQRRLTPRGSRATAFGLAFRYECYAFESHGLESEGWVLGPDDNSYWSSIGLRMITVSGPGLNGDGAGDSMFFSVYTGYMPRFGLPVLTISLGHGYP